MENKDIPKEIWIEDDSIWQPTSDKDMYSLVIEVHRMQCSKTDQKYLHISEVERQLSEKQTEIDNLIKLVAERNAEIAEKDIKIHKLKKQLEK